MRGKDKKIAQVRSFVAGNTIFCIYEAESEAVIREHAKRAELPCASVTNVTVEVQHDTSQK